MISGIQTCCLLMLICQLFTGNSLSLLTLPNIKPDRDVSEIEEGNSTMKIFTISASEENGGTVQIVAACQTNDIVNLNATMIGSNTTVDVYLREPLDTETQSNYTLRFRAISNYTSLRSSEVEVSLIVLDINDTPPKFSQLTYILELGEDTPLSSILNASICADDPDSGQGGVVNYTLQAAGQDSIFYNNTFEIDQRNGSIQMLQPLDYEKRTFYQYRIIAIDGGDPKLSSTADLLIMVKDVQDTPPIFQRLPFMTTISENTLIGTSIYKILATDGDTGIPDNITYSLTYQSNETACDNFLQINNITGVISIKHLMDRDGGTIKRLNGLCIVNVTASEITNTTANKNSQTTKPFTITVQDENDNQPKFSKKQYEGSVIENMRDITISIPGNIQVFDIDQNGYNNIKLTVLNRTGVVPSPESVIYNGTVLLRLTSPLDYENEKDITFLIKAEDTNNPSFVNNSTVIVKINDTNDNDPVFQSRDKDLFLPENSCFNTTVGKIKATDIDSGNYGKIEYRLDRNSSFKIEATTGRVYVSCKNSCARGCNNSLCDNSCLDREKKDRYYLTVSAIDGGGRRTSLPITIYLNDTNDNRPKFRYNSYQIGLLENRKTFSDGKEDLEIQADDVDLSENKTISYKLLQNSPHFHINESTGKITITKEVDYENLRTEANGYINLTVIASDHGRPQQSSSVQLTIRVKDLNDNRPVFKWKTYNASVCENAASGTNVTGVNASDADKTAPNNKQSYFIEKGGSDQFTLNGKTGEISVQVEANLDREIKSKYTLTVIAIDRGDPQNTGTTTVFISLTDENDTPPRWLNLPNTTTVKENATEPAIFKCIGDDSDINHTLVYSIRIKEALDSNGNLVNLSLIKGQISINSTTGIVSVNNLDAEVAVTIRLTVTVNDTSTTKNDSNPTSELKIQITDENDNPPVFKNALYTSVILENAPNNTFLVSMTAIDIDISKNYTTIRYYIDDKQCPFSINSRTGDVIKTGKLDRETKPFWIITIRASDDSTYNATAELNVTVLDFNDNTPFFLNDSYVFNVIEKNYSQTQIGQLYAKDLDAGPNQKITYKITRGNAESYFHISDVNGSLFINGNIDRETMSNYELVVTINDNPKEKADTKLNSTHVIVNILDFNDNAPVFTSNSKQQIRVKETTKLGTVVKTVSATDKDFGSNGTVYYMISSNGNVSYGLFVIDNDTGAISLNESIIDKVGIYTLEVLAIDKGSPPMNSSVLLDIFILDENIHRPEFKALPKNGIISINKDLNDKRPEFNGKTYNASICENAASGTNVTGVFASDADKTPPNNQLSYFIEKGGYDQFTLNDKTGEVSVQLGANLDREIQSNYILTVIAIDKGNPQKTGTTTLFVSLTDENDTPPRWLNLPNTTTVKENTTEPAIFKCIGDDSDINHTLVYSIRIKEALDSNGNLVNLSLIEGKISLNSTTGVVSVNNLDAEVAVTIRLTVTVNDTSTIKNDPNATSELIIQITDENDNPPVFKNALYTTDILENDRDNTYLLSITATDIDISKKYATIKYYIDDKQCPFSINPRTGYVMKTGKLDRETKPFWIVTIRASDDAKYNATAELNVTVLDFNDNTPFFINEPYVFNMMEQSYSQTQIGQLYAKDLDAGPNQKITYKITRGNAESYFHISDVNGSLFINGNIDRETMSNYELVVTINDNPIEKADTKLNSTHVIVNILDVNDNAPVFTSNSKQQIRVKETTKLGTVVGTVSATDKDFGSNGTVYYMISSNGNVSYGLFVIDNDTGAISVIESIIDKVGIYTLEVLAIDKGSPPMNSSVLLDIFILDENIHRPEFKVLPKNGIISINKCVKKGTTLTKIQATDKDNDFNNQLLKYEFFYSNASTGQRFELFHIDNITGEIKLIKDLSYGIKQFFKINVICTDSGFPPLSSITPELTIQITDVIDNPPEFLTNITKVDVKENQNGTILLTTVSAVEKDSTAVIEFKIKDGNYSSFFGINSSSGEISTTKPLDREIMNEITLVVEATDVSKPEIISDQCNNTHVQNDANSLMKVIVTVQDLNDNPPIFRDTEISKFIMHNTVINTIVMDLSEIVMDKDSSIENRKHNFYATNISYTGALKNELKDKIIKANCGQLFCVHPNGTVVTNFVFYKKMKGQAKLQVVANDSAGNTTALIKFYIYDYSHVVAMHIIKKASEVDGIKLEILSMFSNITGYDCIFHKMDIYKEINGESDPFTTLVKFYVVDRETDEVLEASDVVTQFDDVNNDSLARVRNRYSIRSLSDLQYQSEGIDKPSTDKMVYILIAVIALMVVVLGIFTFLYIRNTLRYKMEVNPESTVDREEDKNKSSCPGTERSSMNKDEEETDVIIDLKDV